MESIVVDHERLANVLLISFVLELKGLLEKVYGHVLSLLLLPKYANKWSHKWRENCLTVAPFISYPQIVHDRPRALAAEDDITGQ